jgi:hypothetical protein
LRKAKSTVVAASVMPAIVLNSLVVELINTGYSVATEFEEEPKKYYYQGLKVNNA